MGKFFITSQRSLFRVIILLLALHLEICGPLFVAHSMVLKLHPSLLMAIIRIHFQTTTKNTKNSSL